MKITIDISDAADYGLSPTIVYRRLCKEYYSSQHKYHNHNFWGLEHYCDEAARQLYAQIKERPTNVKNLILTYTDAENVFELFKQFADVWIKNYMKGDETENE